VAEMAASRKEAKYAALQTHHIFQPIAVETLGPINESARSFLDDLGRRISVLSGDDREHLFLFQRISVAIPRFNAVLLHDGFPSDGFPCALPPNSCPRRNFGFAQVPSGLVNINKIIKYK